MSTEKSLLYDQSEQNMYGGAGKDNGSISSLPDDYTPAGTKSRQKKKYRVDNFLPCDPRRWLHRYLMLILMCFLSFGKFDKEKGMW